MDLSNMGGQPQEQTQPQEQPQVQFNQPPVQQPQESNDVLIDNPEFKQQEQQQQEQEPAVQPTQYDDPYKHQGGVRTIRENFEKWLDEKYPLKGKLDITKVNKEDPQALAQFFHDIQENTANDLRNEQARKQAMAEFQEQIFQPVYDVFPKLRQDPTTDSMVKTFYRGAAAENPNISPVQVAAAFSNFVKGVYNQGLQSGKASVQNMPTPPVGNQGRASTEKILNTSVVEKMASGGVDDVANLVASLQGKGVGGL